MSGVPAPAQPLAAGSPERRAYLDEILVRKRVEVSRRLRHQATLTRLAADVPLDPRRGARALEALRRPSSDAPPRIIAEVKFRSPSVGPIRAPAAGTGVRVARAYEAGGAAAISVLADGPGFGGSPLTVRRVARACAAPVLFKEFVLDPVQVELARVCGASMVLLLVRAHTLTPLQSLCDLVRARGMEPVVEAADEAELEVALQTNASLIGVNARDLRTFEVDMERAARCLAGIDPGRVAVFMSGIRSPQSFARLRGTRADAALIGEGLMRCDDPAEGVRAMLEATT
ncbi:MAG: indole-3-glycerol phosphate synthase TrpC [Polyangiales bacterium]|nr:indole-3-glycerol-phosphate synthase [Myxococcales bacterium]MCB9659176.1 indole-3-glycerol-phosphate synthase [Sandaracinaceae bacterium]